MESLCTPCAEASHGKPFSWPTSPSANQLQNRHYPSLACSTGLSPYRLCCQPLMLAYHSQQH